MPRYHASYNNAGGDIVFAEQADGMTGGKPTEADTRRIAMTAPHAASTSMARATASRMQPGDESLTNCCSFQSAMASTKCPAATKSSVEAAQPS